MNREADATVRAARIAQDHAEEDAEGFAERHIWTAHRELTVDGPTARITYHGREAMERLRDGLRNMYHPVLALLPYPRTNDVADGWYQIVADYSLNDDETDDALAESFMSAYERRYREVMRESVQAAAIAAIAEMAHGPRTTAAAWVDIISTDPAPVSPDDMLYGSWRNVAALEGALYAEAIRGARAMRGDGKRPQYGRATYAERRDGMPVGSWRPYRDRLYPDTAR